MLRDVIIKTSVVPNLAEVSPTRARYRFIIIRRYFSATSRAIFARSLKSLSSRGDKRPLFSNDSRSRYMHSHCRLHCCLVPEITARVSALARRDIGPRTDISEPAKERWLSRGIKDERDWGNTISIVRWVSGAPVPRISQLYSVRDSVFFSSF